MIDPNDILALEKLRNESDPVADAVISKIMATGELNHIQSVFEVLRHNTDLKEEYFSQLPDELSSLVWEYFQIGATLPDFADTEKIKKGESIFQRYGPEISMLLLTMALPLCYSCRKGAKVLVMTGRTLDPDKNVDPLARRLLETAQFVIYAMSPGGMSRDGMGITSTLKVRLIHASIRYFILNRQTNPSGWDQEEYGYPINQQDMAGTLISFSALTLYGLSMMGIKLREEEKNSYMHCWKVIGYYIGLKDELLTDNYEEGWQLGLAILRTESEPSQDAKDLTNSCFDFIRAIMPLGLFSEYFETMMYYFCNSIGKEVGKDMPEILGLSHRITFYRKIEIWIMSLFCKVLSIEEKILPFLQLEVGKFNQAFLKALSSKYNSKKGIEFYIPPGLKSDWDIT